MSRRRIILQIMGGGGGLPSIYQEVEYLASVSYGLGPIYINTGLRFTHDDVEIQIGLWQETDSVSYENQLANFNNYVGCYDGTNAITAGAQRTGSNVFSIQAGTSFDTMSGVTGKWLRGGNWYDLTVTAKNGIRTVYVPASQTPSPVNLQGTYNGSVAVNADFYVHAMNNNGIVGYSKSVRRISYCIVKEAGEKVLDLIPCYRKADSKPGMYDLVSGTFFVNQGSVNDFTCGPDVN